MPESPASLADTNQKLWRQLLLVQFAVFGVTCLYAIWTQRYLYGDGCNFLLMLLQRRVATDYFPGRHFAHIITQTPMITLIRDWGCRDTWVLGSVYGATLYFVPLSCLPLTMWAAWRAPGQVLAYPIVAFAILFLDNYGFIISEINLAAAIFWPMLYLLLFSNRLTATRSIVLLALALVATRSYEIYLFLAWPLVVAALYRARLGYQARRYGEIAVTLVSFGLFVTAFLIAQGSIFDPDIPASVDGFRYHVMLHVLYPPVWFSLAFLAGSVWILMLPELRRGRWIVHSFAIGFAVFALGIMCFGFVGAWYQCCARVQSLYVPLLLGTLVVAKTIVPVLRSEITTSRQVELWRLAAGACFVATLFQLGSTVVWSRYRASLLNQLAKDQGIVAFEELMGIDWIEESRTREPVGLTNGKIGQFHWNWTMPSLSLALSATNLGYVSTIICVPEMTEWQPFDPLDPAAIPNLTDYQIKNKLQSKTKRP